MNKNYIVLFLIIIFSSLINYSSLATGHDWGGDFSGYIMQARSISEGSMQSSLEHNTFTIFESSFIIGPPAYPWGFPLLLSPVLHVFGLNLIALKTVNIILFAFFLITLFVLFSQHLSLTEATIFISIFAFNPTILAFHNNILSDISFLFFSMLSILLIDRVYGLNRSSTVSASKYIFLGLAISYAFFTRTNGILLLTTLLLCQITQGFCIDLKKHIHLYKMLVYYSIPYIVFFATLIFSSLIFPSGENPQFDIFRSITFQSIMGNISYYFKLPYIFYIGVPFPILIYLATLPFTLIGLLHSIRKDYHIIIYFVLTFILYILWPFQQGIRYIIPAMPFYIYFAFKGMNWSFRRIQQFSKLGHSLSVIFWCVLIAFFLRSSLMNAEVNISQGRRMAGPFEKESLEMFDFVSRHTETNSIIVFFKPRVMRMLTSRSSIMINGCTDLSKGNYYVYHKEMGSQYQVLLKNIKECSLPINLGKIFDNEKFTVYRITNGLKPSAATKTDKRGFQHTTVR